VTDLSAWVGRTERSVETLSGLPSAALAATLDRPAPVETVLPPLWHWLHFLPRAPRSSIGQDGHPRTGGFLPPVPLPRRMWAGGSLEFIGGLSVGDVVEKTSIVESIDHKKGRSGELWFVAVRHEYRVDRRIRILERQDIVYRDMPVAGQAVAAREPGSQPARWERLFETDPVLLFRFSALTFNAHRIHYDAEYAQRVEHYPGLVVHGPLQAMLALESLASSEPGSMVSRFSFRSVAPLFCGDAIRIRGIEEPDAARRSIEVCDASGGVAMKCSVELAATHDNGVMKA
jgi:3-methylfumaryl-CoA hydratase